MTAKYEIRIGEALRNAWTIFCKGPEVFVTICFASFGCAWVFSHLPAVGTLANILLSALTPAAYYLVADYGSRHEQISFAALEPLPALLPHLLTLSIVKCILLSLGFVCLVIPGIYLAVILSFAELFVVTEKKTFVEAMKASKLLVSQNFWGVLGLCTFLLLLIFSGVLLIGLGVLVTAPLAVVVHYCVFRRIHVRVV